MKVGISKTRKKGQMATRKVVDGAVKYHGFYYRPSDNHQLYHDEFEGLWVCVSGYLDIDGFCNTLYFHGLYDANNPAEYTQYVNDDGSIPFMFWDLG